MISLSLGDNKIYLRSDHANRDEEAIVARDRAVQN